MIKDTNPSRSKVLIVADIIDNLALLEQILLIENLEVSSAFTGEAALDSINRSRPDIILLDVNMPGMNGYEVCEILKKKTETCEIPVIFLTANDAPEHILRGFAAGGVDYVTKPFNIDVLIARIKTHLELRFSIELTSRQNEMLNRQNATKDKFCSIIAHDIRNSFTVVAGYAKTILEEFDELDMETIQKFIGNMYSASTKGSELLDNILTWTMALSGEIAFLPEKLSVGNICSEVLLSMNESAEKKQIELRNNCKASIYSIADRNMVSTILRNLVSNAIKFTPSGGEIRIDSNWIKGYVEVSVTDNGVGVKKENIERLFKIDEKYTTRGTEREVGSGFGLILCKIFVEKNGGNLVVESEPGKGSKFSFSLPEYKE